MNRPIAARGEDDGEVRRWIAEAVDPRVEPRREHYEAVRELLRIRLGSFERTTNGDNCMSDRFTRLQIALISASALFALG